MVSGRPVSSKRRAVFLDRDGVLVVPEFRDERSFAPTTLEEFRIYDEAPETLARLKAAGFALVVVTNQPDVGKGLIPAPVLEEMHRRLATALPIDRIEVCTHTQNEDCACRKPKPGMLLKAAEALGIALAESFMVGDRAGDVTAGQAVGCQTIFIDLGYVEPKPKSPTYTVSCLSEVADVILDRSETQRGAE